MNSSDDISLRIAACLPNMIHEDGQSMYDKCISTINKAIAKRNKNSKTKSSSYDRICREFMVSVNSLFLDVTTSSGEMESHMSEVHSLSISSALTSVMDHIIKCAHYEAMQEFPVTGAVLHARHLRKAVRNCSFLI